MAAQHGLGAPPTERCLPLLDGRLDDHAVGRGGGLQAAPLGSNLKLPARSLCICACAPNIEVRGTCLWYSSRATRPKRFRPCRRRRCRQHRCCGLHRSCCLADCTTASAASKLLQCLNVLLCHVPGKATSDLLHPYCISHSQARPPASPSGGRLAAALCAPGRCGPELPAHRGPAGAGLDWPSG